MNTHNVVISNASDYVTKHTSMNIHCIDNMIMNVITNNIDIRHNPSINVTIIHTNITIINIESDVENSTGINISIGFIINTSIHITINNSINNISTDIISNNAIITDIRNNINMPYWK